MFAHTALFTVYSEGIKYKIVFKVAEALILGKKTQKPTPFHLKYIILYTTESAVKDFYYLIRCNVFRL